VTIAIGRADRAGQNLKRATLSRLRVIVLSDAFKSFWNDLAADLDAIIDAVEGPADSTAPMPETVAVILAAGGAEAEAVRWLDSHTAIPGLPVLVVGTDPGRRTAMQLTAHGASD